MRKKLNFIYAVALICLTGTAWSQNDMTLYNMNFVHTRMNLNPALRPQAKVNFGIPGLGYTFIVFTNS